MKRPSHSVRRSLRRRIAASIACLVFVLQGLVPVLAQAAASVARAQFFPGELCSSDHAAARVRLVEAIRDETPAPPASFGAAHCPFCALPCGADAPTPSTFGWRIPEFEAAAQPVVASVADSPEHPARGRPQAPRAPPHG